MLGICVVLGLRKIATFIETVVVLNIKQQHGRCVFNLPFDGGVDEP
jgi:hypothetical protein